MKHFKISLLLTFFGLSFTCHSYATNVNQEATAISALDVNDVSFLLPLASGKPYPSINLSATSTLLPVQILQEVLSFENPGTPILNLPYPNSEILAQYDRWHVTSFRYDNCGDSIEQRPLQQILEVNKKTGVCQPRFRVVLQPFLSSGQPLITALHLSFRLDEKTSEVVVSALMKIKSKTQQHPDTATNGVPLVIHPGLAKEASSTLGPIAKLIKELFTKVQNSNSLDVVTMTLSVDARHWKLAGGMVSNGHWQRFVTSFNRRLYQSDTVANLGVEEIKCNFYDICNSLPQDSQMGQRLLTKIFRPGFAKRPDLEKENTETTLTAQMIDNTRTHFFSTNCLSCHESSNYRDREKINIEANYFSHPTGITPFTPKSYVSDSPATIINFGYEGVIPSISTRTAAESAAVAARINKANNVNNPGFTPKNYSDFWSCLMAADEFQTCLVK